MTKKKSPYPLHRFPASGWARLKDIIGDRRANPPKPAFFPIGRSEIFRRIERGEFPAGMKLSPKMHVWKWEDLHDFAARLHAAGKFEKIYTCSAPTVELVLAVREEGRW
jgi:prophage regulatory protein